MSRTILIVEDESTLSHFLRESLLEEGYEVVAAGTGREGLEAVGQREIDLVLLDLKLPDVEGMEVLRAIRAGDAELPVIMMTGYGSVGSAVEAMRLKVYDYLEKPPDLDDLKLTIARALESRALREELARLRGRGDGDRPWVIGDSPAMREIERLVARLAASKASVLIQGESGTGKEVIARALYRQSDRADGPFVAINCAAIPDTLLESELFGHERGAFTDAKRQKKGLLETADGGTLFLDEIGSMRPDLQAKLLRVLETESFRRVGGERDIQVDIRVVSASNRDLRAAMDSGEFREDLYYRLKVVAIEVPPLRDRPGDVDPMVLTFLAEYAEAMGKNVTGVSEEAMELLRRYDWPGNVRELRNVMERAVILCDGDEIQPAHLPGEIVTDRAFLPLAPSLEATLDDAGIDLKGTVAEFERRMIAQALERTGGNQSEAARLLGVTRDVLRYSLSKYGLK